MSNKVKIGVGVIIGACAAISAYVVYKLFIAEPDYESDDFEDDFFEPDDSI